jgi:hypothetical protein
VAMDDAGLGIENEIDFDVKTFAETGPECCGDALVCEHCGSESLTLSREIDKPSWTAVFRSGSASCPEWYATSLNLDDRRFWDGAMGEGFSDWYDWYLKSSVESAREPETDPERAPATQLEFAWN